ncbi:MAG: alpha/beta hydrolase fold protein [Rhodocyclaceae bacterium]|nr:MAG: alpha/beta hydrolase fold protein [Rhodocyclaceae bacterium]
MHPDDLLEQIKANANPRKQRNLEIVHTVCREQYELGSKDFSVATIARIAHKRGGPTAGSIHNKTGDDFKGIIKAWASHTGGSLKKLRKVGADPVFSILDKIPDPAVRSVFGAVLAENRKLRGEVTFLKANSNIVIDRRIISDSPQKTPVGQVLPAHLGLNEDQVAALKHAVSDTLMQSEGWKADEFGRVINDKGRVIFRPGFVTAIRQIMVNIEQPAGHEPRNEMIELSYMGVNDQSKCK